MLWPRSKSKRSEASKSLAAQPPGVEKRRAPARSVDPRRNATRLQHRYTGTHPSTSQDQDERNERDEQRYSRRDA